MNTVPNRVLTTLLAAAMLTAVSCGSQAADSTKTEPVVSASGSETETAAETALKEIPLDQINRENAVCSLPELNFENMKVNVLHAGSAVDAQDVYAEQTGDVVDEAVYQRNLWMEETLNIDWNPISVEESTYNTAGHLAKTILAAEDLYDLAAVHQAFTSKYITEGYFTNMAHDEYIDWEKPWWNLPYMQELTVGQENLFFLQGDISLMRMKSLACVYYNKTLCEELYDDADYMYDLVLDGKWTFDKFAEMTREAYSDTNGNSKPDEGDRFGSFGSFGKSIEHFFYAAGVVATTKNKDGIPEFTMNNEKTVSFNEKMYHLYNENPGFHLVKKTDDAFEDDVADFAAGNYLFAPLWFRHVEELRNMEIDYGIINFPKYDEDSEYKTLVHDGTTIYCVPVTSQITDKIGAVCEAMAFYNYKHVTPTYFEVAMKVKYSRDEKSSQVIDMISQSAYTNFGYAYYLVLGDLNYRSLVKKRSTDFASWYQKRIDKANAKLEELVNLYLEQ